MIKENHPDTNVGNIEYIRREDALKGQKTGTFANGIRLEAKRCVPVDYIESLEPADVVPVVHGRWIDADFCGQYECSECGNNAVDLYDYCPFCGAIMDAHGEE